MPLTGRRIGRIDPSRARFHAVLLPCAPSVRPEGAGRLCIRNTVLTHILSVETTG